MIRRLLCRVGIHRWQYLLAMPTWGRGDEYQPGIWCIWCCAKSPHRPGAFARDEARRG
ncbi:MAG: hypothetical protein K8T90_09115 [Planctomycetes bacterium]|nr:hypothetical protein [Planctomycetota bacterium]